MSERRSSATASAGDNLNSPKLDQRSVRRKTQTWGPCPSSKKDFALCLAFRAMNSLLVQTCFNPDEHWQALEVAHRITFGPLSTSFETELTVVGLFYWPCMRASSKNEVSRKGGLAMAALACAMRPTSAIIWVHAGLLELFVARDRLQFMLLEVIPVGLLWNSQLALGYFSQGFTVMIFSFLPFTIFGIFMSKHWKLSGLLAWVLGLHSLLGHKEFRFVLPVLPIALILSGYSLSVMESSLSSIIKKKGSLENRSKCFTKRQLAVISLLITNMPMA